MSDLKIKGVPVSIGGRDFELVFDLNVIDEIEERFGTIGDMVQQISRAGALRDVLAIALNDYVDRRNEECPDAKLERVTARWVGRSLLEKDRARMMAAVAQAFRESMPEATEAPNAKAGQTNGSR